MKVFWAWQSDTHARFHAMSSVPRLRGQFRTSSKRMAWWKPRRNLVVTFTFITTQRG
jgi:hypothetical protein